MDRAGPQDTALPPEQSRVVYQVTVEPPVTVRRGPVIVRLPLHWPGSQVTERLDVTGP